MPDPAPSDAGMRQRRAWRRWLTIGEVVGLGALAVAVLGYVDAHRERVGERRERAAVERRQARADALVLRGTADPDGARVRLAPVNAGQVVQSQRYVFPRAVLDHVMEVSAAEPQIDRAWIPAASVKALSEAARASGGEGRLTVGVLTRYVEDGEDRTDQSLYRLGYRVERAGLFGGERLVLQGVSPARRGVRGDLQAAVESQARGG